MLVLCYGIFTSTSGNGLKKLLQGSHQGSLGWEIGERKMISAVEAKKKSRRVAEKIRKRKEDENNRKWSIYDKRIEKKTDKQYSETEQAVVYAIESSINDGKTWMDICWDYIYDSDPEKRIVIVRALRRVAKKLEKRGFSCSKPYISQYGYIIFKVSWN